LFLNQSSLLWRLFLWRSNLFLQSRFLFSWNVKSKLRSKWLSDVDRDLSYAVLKGLHTAAGQLIPHASPLAKDCALWQASFHGDKPLQTLLLANNANPQAHWDGVLCRSAAKGDTQGIYDALNQGASLHNNNDLPLFLAASNGHEEATLQLLNSGADVHRAFNPYTIAQCKESKVNNAKAMDIIEWAYFNRPPPVQKKIGFKPSPRAE